MNEIAELFSMTGRVAMVTGAASGMGERFAHTLSRAGARVICAARRKERVDRVAAEIRAAGGEALALALDIGDVAAIHQGFDTAAQAFGAIDVLVNNAGQLDFGTVPTISDESWDRLLQVNLSGTLRMTREFAQRLIAAGKPGAIVNISSITGMQVMRQVSGYGIIKAAVNQLTRQAAVDLFEHRIRCNAIAPGYFHTEMSEGVFATEAGKAIEADLPLKRAGRVEELDGALLLLASEAGAHINGVVLPVDAGHVVQLT
jgi:NAD(P)-dependent dehydrogenase (short-subunit alcohol dehydrogenase family)